MHSARCGCNPTDDVFGACALAPDVGSRALIEPVAVAAMPHSGAKITVVFATLGRAATLKRSVEHLRSQKRRADRIVVSATSADDTAGLDPSRDLEILYGRPGLARQRNRALERVSADTDIIVFFDDDFVPHSSWLAVAESYFAKNPRVAALTGHVAADGVSNHGLSFEEGLAAVEDCAHAAGDYCIEGYSPYGCNMAFRAEAIRGLTFDERLVLYSWLEDRDFGGALRRRGGRLVKIGAAVGAHLGVKTGRMSGRRLGYSQIVNPIYLHRKGTMTTVSLCEHLARNLIANASRSLAPEAYIDRVGRLRGNLQGLFDVLTGRDQPERAELL